MSDINARIRSFRKGKNLTQKKFCLLTNTSQGHLSDIENAKGKPSGDMLIAMAISFKDLDLRWLLTGEKSEGVLNPLKEDVLREVIEVVEWALKEIDADPEPGKKAELISAVYDFCLDEDVPRDRGKLIKLVKAVA